MVALKTPTYIFIVENDKHYIKLLDYIFLKDINYRFVNFKSGEECLTNINLNPEMIVLDHTLPGINGYETLVQIKKESPDTHVLMMLSHKDEKLPSDLFEAGADDYILKEADYHGELSNRIESFLKRRLNKNAEAETVAKIQARR
jgi:DNA-binding response OmpR family regulator